MPLLKQRVVMITISDVGEGLLRVNVIPRKLEGSADENGALTVPLSITGKAEELDRELPGQLTSFTESVTKTGSNIDELKTQHAAAIKAVEAENKKKIDDKKKGNGSKTANTSGQPDSNRGFQGRQTGVREQNTPNADRKREPVRHSNVDGGYHGGGRQ
jgi:PRTRC genetic system protein E